MPTLGRLCMEIVSPMASSQRYEANWSAKTHGWRYFHLAHSSITIWGGCRLCQNRAGPWALHASGKSKGKIDA